jgi:serine/threonine protein kinase
MPDRDDHTPTEDDSTETAFPPDRTPERIGRYKILEKIGEGGMGVVYLAEQEAPLRRRVALKVIKPGMDSKQVLARFEAERQALALMNHPGVAKVFDAGSTPEGRPYFVMEHVAGLPITEYCDKHLLDNRQRLALFIQVCDAIYHAHQQGIIHRDIKPSNVLVAVQDGKPVPKVIDFGVAKATSQRLTEKTLFTEQGVLIGTLEYMSPEQAEMTALDVDSRTDIYALGVLLYELLVGALPFDPKEIRRAGFAEMQRIIREEQTPMPSTRVTSLGAKAADVARRRRVDVRTLRSQLRGDLDRISLKALDKDRTRRYASAVDLGDDLGRHLRGESIRAGPPSRVASLRRLARAAPRLLPVVLLMATIAWIASSSDVKVTLPSRRQLELKYYDFLLSNVRGSLAPPADLAIVAIDDDSYQIIGRDRTLAWPRGLHAELIRTLKREGARAVAFDVVFADRGADPAQDAALAKALTEAGNVVLGSSVEITEDPRVRQAQVLDPYEPFKQAAAAVADVNLPVDSDGVIRYAELAREGRSSLALAAYEVATGDRSMRGESGRLIAFSGPARTVPTVSVYQALDPSRYLPPGFFRGKIVFVGVSRGAAPGHAEIDAFLTPFHGQTFGVEIHANILDSLRRGNWIVPCGSPEEWIVFIAMAAAAFGLGLAPWSLRTRVFASAGLVLGYGVLGAVAFISFRYWLPMIGPVAITLLACGVGLWMRQRRMRTRAS